MSKKKAKPHNPEKLIEVIEKWSLPIYDIKHDLYIYVEGQARSNQTRLEHIVESSHDLKVRDLMDVPNGINGYFVYKKDPVYKTTISIEKARIKGLQKYQSKLIIRILDEHG